MTRNHLAALSPSPLPWLHEIRADGHLYALVVRQEYRAPGMQFVTPGDLALQAGLACHPSGTIIPAHRHKYIPRAISHTLEVLVMRYGSLLARIYDAQDPPQLVESLTLHTGDMLVLVAGGHGFEALTDVEILEVKQGPYLSHDTDKELF